jgi:integrase
VLSLGLRKGEALALRWPDIELDAGELIVRGTLKRRKGAGLYLDTPKTAAGWRTVPLVGGTVEALREHYKRQLAEQLASPVWIGSGHVFASTIGGPLDARNVTRWWHNLLSRAGVARRRFQATRHTAATAARSGHSVSRPLGNRWGVREREASWPSIETTSSPSVWLLLVKAM